MPSEVNWINKLGSAFPSEDVRFIIKCDIIRWTPNCGPGRMYLNTLRFHSYKWKYKSRQNYFGLLEVKTVITLGDCFPRRKYGRCAFGVLVTCFLTRVLVDMAVLLSHLWNFIGLYFTIYLILYLSITFHLKFKEKKKIGIDWVIQRGKAFKGPFFRDFLFSWGNWPLIRRPTLTYLPPSHEFMSCLCHFLYRQDI